MFRRSPSDSRLQRYAFITVFALVGVVFAYFALAATATTSFSGSLNKKNSTRSHSVTTTASGTFSATGTASTKGKNAGSSPLTLQLKASNGTLIAQATGDPATLSAPVGIGSYTINVSASASSSNNVSYTVDVSYPIADPSPPSDTTPPTAPTGLTATAINTSQVNLAWQSATDNVGVASYDVLRNGVKISSTMTTTYNDVNVSPATTYSYTVKARDAAGNLSTASNTATATTQSAADTTAPNISITSPANGATVAGIINLTGSATDNVGVSKVEVQVDSNGYTPASFNAGTVNGTFSYSLNTTLFSDGTHTLTARAIDTSGNQKTTAITITIKNTTTPPPTTAPETQGTWVSPEGLTIDVNTMQTNIKTGKLWTIADMYRLLLPEVTTAGDFATIAPMLRINVQDQYSAITTSTARYADGKFASYRATMFLGGPSNRSFWLSTPEGTVGHEYGHAWTLYYHYYANNNDWTNYLTARGILGDSRLESSYSWARAEIIADDYRELFASQAAKDQRRHLNTDIPEPTTVPGLRDFLLGDFRTP